MSNQKICLKCGTLIIEGYKFCHACGLRLERLDEKPSPLLEEQLHKKPLTDETEALAIKENGENQDMINTILTTLAFVILGAVFFFMSQPGLLKEYLRALSRGGQYEYYRDYHYVTTRGSFVIVQYIDGFCWLFYWYCSE